MSEHRDLAAAALRLSETFGHVARRHRQLRPQAGPSWREAAAMLRIATHGPATSAELARQEGVTPQSMGATLAAVQARGLIQRGADPQDGRRVVFSLTRAGERYYAERIDARADQMLTALRVEFDDDEVARLLAAAPLLDRLAERMYLQSGRSPADPPTPQTQHRSTP